MLNQVTNNYTNPPLQLISRFSLRKLEAQTFAEWWCFRSTTSTPWSFRNVLGESTINSDPTSKIAFTSVLAANTTAFSTWTFTQAVQYRVSICGQTREVGVGVSSTTRFRLIWVDSNGNVIADTVSVVPQTPQNLTMSWATQFVFVPSTLLSYTVRLQQTGTATGWSAIPMASFDVNIEEITNPSDNSINFASASPSAFSFQNSLSGDVSVVLKNSAASWRIAQSGSALVFQKESTPGSGVWVTKSSLN